MKKDKTPSYIRIGVLTVVTTLCWVFFSAYRTLTAKPAPNVPEKIISPFNPNLETEEISAIEERIFFEEGQVSAQVVLSPTPAPDLEEDNILPPEEELPSPTPTEEEQVEEQEGQDGNQTNDTEGIEQ